MTSCTGLPRYDVPLAPLPASSRAAGQSFVMPDGAVLPTKAWEPTRPPRAVVLALHGFNDSRDAWDLPAPAFAQAGIAVFAPDQRGFGAAPTRGRWPGARQLADDAQSMLQSLRQRFPGVPLFAMGESMGGAVLMALAGRADAPNLDGWILLSPAVWSRELMGPGMSGALWLASSLAPGLSVTGGEVALKVVASDNREALLALVRNPLTIRRTRFDTLRGLTDLMDEAQAAAPHLHGPVLALYGAKDTVVPAAATARAWARMPPGVRFGFYPDGYHMMFRDLGRAAPIGDALSWIQDRGDWLPSGADFAAAGWIADNH